MSQGDRTALLIRCSVEEAEKIRASAQEEGRTISAHVVRIVMRHIALREKFQLDHIEGLRRRGLAMEP